MEKLRKLPFARIVAIASVAFILLVVSGLIWYAHGHSIPVLQPKGEIGSKERQLIFFALGLSVIVVVPVFIMLFSFAWKYRASNTKASYQPNWDNSHLYEGLWWAIPSVLIVVLSVVTWQSSHQLDPYQPIKSNAQPLKVQVVALQWKWLFMYPDQGVATVNYMPIPTDRPIDLTITSDAPMNAFWVPQLGGQVYAMAGMSMQLHLIADHAGAYEGRSSNISGKGFADMTFTANAMPQASFDQWVTQTKGHHLDLTSATYAALAKPATSKQLTYGAVQPNLYDTIIKKYMGNMNTSTTDHNYHVDRPTAQHDMSDMPDMHGMSHDGMEME
ncbi:MAG TPA: ubiquinol oxidase subunit II [Candidatus Saccharimonadales bacterium]|nr:ubiquinol oxidase subunit II [Candidatus Saccharimonadales bacterium]